MTAKYKHGRSRSLATAANRVKTVKNRGALDKGKSVEDYVQQGLTARENRKAEKEADPVAWAKKKKAAYEKAQETTRMNQQRAFDRGLPHGVDHGIKILYTKDDPL